MKYIRTEDGRIYDLSHFNYDDKFHWYVEKGKYINMIERPVFPRYFCWKDEYDKIPNCFGKLIVEQLDKNEIKQADTIEELCDEFVLDCENKLLNRIFKDLRDARILGSYVECDHEYYGAIWTDKGLIYVAKIKGILPNGEIDWELL